MIVTRINAEGVGPMDANQLRELATNSTLNHWPPHLGVVTEADKVQYLADRLRESVREGETWGCECGWSEWEEYDQTVAEQPANGHIDQWGGFTRSERRG